MLPLSASGVSVLRVRRWSRGEPRSAVNRARLPHSEADL